MTGAEREHDGIVTQLRARAESVEVLHRYHPEPQVQDDAKTTYARKLSKAEAELDWSLAAEVLERRVRAFNPWPVAWCMIGGRRLRVWRAEVVDNEVGHQPGQVLADQQSFVVGTAKKALKLLEIQRPGGQRMTAEQFLNAHNPQTW